VRWLLLGNILCWMIYDFVFKAWTPFLSNIFFTISCVTALIRFRKKSGNSQTGKEKEGK
jgi:hypothetical protein